MLTMPPETSDAAPPPILPVHRVGPMGRLRNYLLTGLLALAPSALTLWVLIRLFNWVDNLLGRYFRFAALDGRRIPGLGFIATMRVLVRVGWTPPWFTARSLSGAWYHSLQRIPVS